MIKKAVCGGAEKDTRSRCFHLLDIENLVGRADPSVGEIVTVLADYGIVSGRHAGDHVWICCSSVQTMANLALASSGARFACRLGRDGAELAIDEELDWGWIAERFHRVAVGSGDHFFAPRMAFLASRGVDVTCIARDGSLSAANRLASHRVRLLPKHPLTGHVEGAHHVA